MALTVNLIPVNVMAHFHYPPNMVCILAAYNYFLWDTEQIFQIFIIFSEWRMLYPFVDTICDQVVSPQKKK